MIRNFEILSKVYESTQNWFENDQSHVFELVLPPLLPQWLSFSLWVICRCFPVQRKIFIASRQSLGVMPVFPVPRRIFKVNLQSLGHMPVFPVPRRIFIASRQSLGVMPVFPVPRKNLGHRGWSPRSKTWLRSFSNKNLCTFTYFWQNFKFRTRLP